MISKSIPSKNCGVFSLLWDVILGFVLGLDLVLFSVILYGSSEECKDSESRTVSSFIHFFQTTNLFWKKAMTHGQFTQHSFQPLTSA